MSEVTTGQALLFRFSFTIHFANRVRYRIGSMIDRLINSYTNGLAEDAHVGPKGTIHGRFTLVSTDRQRMSVLALAGNDTFCLLFRGAQTGQSIR